ncbi:MAG: FAD-binding domain-containing protein [Gammaproteobacteria bacterium]
MQVVWYKRDLRIHDHRPLTTAASHGPVLPLYILEPELWKQPDLSYRQYDFLKESLSDLNKYLKEIGQPLIIKTGDAISILNEINKKHRIDALWSHQETWNGWTYARDKKIKSWTKKLNIPWYEFRQSGVIRCLKNRDGWANQWNKEMNKALVLAPKGLDTIDEDSEELPAAETVGLENDHCIFRQKGGRSEGLKILLSFFEGRGEHYTKGMSSPVTAFDNCSRLSPHIAFGNLSLREIYQYTEDFANKIELFPKEIKGKWPSALRSFSGRLRWHCHFIQKLEDQPSIEFENMHAGYNSLRTEEFNHNYFKAWKEGKTGYPMIDACMRALKATGWINFRMRAMLMSFASYNLWLHWRKTALHLAQLFTDYEPGIHYSQVQMQSGTTGINTIRIYSPTKQAIDQDPKGIFIRKWIPELQNIPQECIHTPWVFPKKLNGYPMPIVDEKTSRKNAAQKIQELRKKSEHKQSAKIIISKHASRKNSFKDKKKQKEPVQSELNI